MDATSTDMVQNGQLPIQHKFTHGMSTSASSGFSSLTSSVPPKQQQQQQQPHASSSTIHDEVAQGASNHGGSQHGGRSNNQTSSSESRFSRALSRQTNSSWNRCEVRGEPRKVVELQSDSWAETPPHQTAEKTPEKTPNSKQQKRQQQTSRVIRSPRDTSGVSTDGGGVLSDSRQGTGQGMSQDQEVKQRVVDDAARVEREARERRALKERRDAIDAAK